MEKVIFYLNNYIIYLSYLNLTYLVKSDNEIIEINKQQESNTNIPHFGTLNNNGVTIQKTNTKEDDNNSQRSNSTEKKVQIDREEDNLGFHKELISGFRKFTRGDTDAFNSFRQGRTSTVSSMGQAFDLRLHSFRHTLSQKEIELDRVEESKSGKYLFDNS